MSSVNAVLHLRAWRVPAAGLLAAFVGLVVFTAVDAGGGKAPAVRLAPRRLTPLQAYSEQSALRAGAAGVDGARPAPDLVPLAVADFDGPIAAFRVYAAAQLRRLIVDVRSLEHALASGRRGASELAWEGAWARYLHLGAVYGEFGSLDQEIDGTPGGLPGGTSDPHFTGLHRIEMGLWDGAPPAGLVRSARRLAVNVQQLRAVVARVPVTPLEYATRAHEILEDALRDLLSGTDVPWSGEGVLGTAAGLDATEEVLRTLQPLLDGRGDAIETSDTWLLRLRSALDGIRRSHGGSWPANNELSQTEREQLDGTIGAALEALDQVPGALETSLPRPVPTISSGAAR